MRLPNPFPGLRPFEAGESHLFFGREGQSAELLRLLREQRFVVVVGTSGSGKSSLARAGLLPLLHAGFMAGAGSEWRVALLRPGGDPFGNLARALAAPGVLRDDVADASLEAGLNEATLRLGALGLVERVAEAGLPAGQNLLVVVDQFEEVFRLERGKGRDRFREDAAAFVKLLLEAAGQRNTPIFVLLTMRSDFLGDCARFRDLPEAINRGQYLIPRLTRDQRRLAITGPVRVGGAEITDRLVNRLLNDAGDDPDQLPILQHALMRTWDCWAERATSGAPIDLEHYEQVGGWAETLKRHADEAYGDLDDGGRALAERVFRRLTERGPDNREIRRPTVLADLAAVTGASASAVATVVDVFRKPGRSFLMPTAGTPLSDDTWIDISHESLIRNWDRLKGWVDVEAESAHMYRRLAETAVLNAQGRAGLWQDPDLQLALEWWQRDRPNAAWAEGVGPGFEPARVFLDRSRAARDAARRQRRRQRQLLIGGLSIAVVVLAFLTILARSQAASAVRERARADLQRDSAIAARRVADSATQAALRAERVAWLDALRLRKQQFRAATDANNIADWYLLVSDTLNAARGHQWKAGALIQLGDMRGALDELNTVLRTNPDNLWALIARSDVSLNLARPDSTVLDTRHVLRLQPHSPLANLNLAVAFAQLRQYDSSVAAFRRALAATRHEWSGGSQNMLSPDIERVTGRRFLEVTGAEQRASLRYGIAAVLAYDGRSGFADALTAADTDTSEEAVLNALNWVWLHQRVVPGDYGAWAATGALWERVGRPAEAVRAYQQFRDARAKHADSRYDGLATWVGSRLEVLGGTAAAPTTEARAEDARALQIEAGAFIARDQWDSANMVIARAVRLAPTDLGLHLDRASVLLSRAWREISKEDKANPDTARIRLEALRREANTIIRLAPDLGIAYYYRAWADFRTDRARFVTRIQRDLERALASDPTDGGALRILAWVMEAKGNVDSTIRLLGRVSVLTPDADIFYQIGLRQNSAGRHQEALTSIRRAINLDRDQLEYFEVEETAMEALKISRSAIDHLIWARYAVAGDDWSRRGDPLKAFNGFCRSATVLLRARSDSSVAGPGDLRNVVTKLHREAAAWLGTGNVAHYYRTVLIGYKSLPEDAWLNRQGAPVRDALLELLQAEVDRRAPAH